MSAGGPVWIVTPKGRGERLRRADVPVPQELSVEALRHRAIWERWVRGERQAAARGTLLKEVADAGIEAAETACELLLREGWIERRERLQGGSWQWDRVVWRDLERLQRLLGVAGRQQRETERREALAQAKEWLRGRSDASQPTALDADLLDELTRGVQQLERDGALPLETLRVRLALLRAVADWRDRGEQGMRRDFALRALGDTKALGAADWRWLEAAFDLERLRIAQFAPMLWIAGEASLWWGERRIDLGPVHCLGVPLEDVARTDAFGPVTRYWLIENRASFERQARGLPAGVVLLWMPGRPSSAWSEAVEHLLRLAPAPAWISADADPAGVDIACSVGALWDALEGDWVPYRMGITELGESLQRWPLNEHDRALLDRLRGREQLPKDLRDLCDFMALHGRKAEQEGWL
jgi:hypothetical protein